MTDCEGQKLQDGPGPTSKRPMNEAGRDRPRLSKSMEDAHGSSHPIPSVFDDVCFRRFRPSARDTIWLTVKRRFGDYSGLEVDH